MASEASEMADKMAIFIFLCGYSSMGVGNPGNFYILRNLFSAITIHCPVEELLGDPPEEGDPGGRELFPPNRNFIKLSHKTPLQVTRRA